MTDPDHDLESALAGLRPRPPGAAVTAALARELDPPVSRRGVILAWTAGLTSVATSASISAESSSSFVKPSTLGASGLFGLRMTRPCVVV